MTDETDDQLWKLQRRKVITVGNSAAITLHKDERRKMGITEGDKVIVRVTEDGTMRIEPAANDG
ncbi:MAG: AbrB/MazE/SpoVT family DNA-binding domain-containing protein [Candidatus Nanohaloarchaea archaeon]|nr:AbrB/MazE/SpoVT family DNA-binding domain-containing protein [Candidatus Nanohaloarchaea archaeon]